jgi:hypothetical protein
VVPTRTNFKVRRDPAKPKEDELGPFCDEKVKNVGSSVLRKIKELKKESILEINPHVDSLVAGATHDITTDNNYWEDGQDYIGTQSMLEELALILKLMTRKTVCQQSTISWLTFGQTSQKNWVA